MNVRAKPMPSLIILSLLVTQCATPQNGVMLGNASEVSINCRYTSTHGRTGRSEVECMLDNKGNAPAQIQFKQASLEDPVAEIQPVGAKRVQNLKGLETVVVILGIIVIAGIVIALATKSKSSFNYNYTPSIHIGISDSTANRPQSSIKEDMTKSGKVFSTDTIEIPAYRSVSLIFKVKHGPTKPKLLVLKLGDDSAEKVKVPIKEPFGKSSGRSDFDY